jgi:broad specificity phosphatase PhoE
MWRFKTPPMSPSNSRLILVRHGQTKIDPKTPVAEWRLDPQGGADLARLAALPLFQGARRIVASTEPKALLTAEAIRSAHGLGQIDAFDGLREIHKATFVEDHDGVMARFFAEPTTAVLPRWEVAATATARFRACLDELIPTMDGDLVVVSHGTILSLYLANLLGQERVDPAVWAAIGFPDLAVVDLWERRILQPFGAWRIDG